jgi:hypothetical protein
VKGWHLFWLAWFLTSFGVFLAAEIYTLATNWRHTLSASIWDLEKFRNGQPISQWSVGHLWFVGILGLLFLWLFFHFALGWWRS